MFHNKKENPEAVQLPTETESNHGVTTTVSKFLGIFRFLQLFNDAFIYN